MRNSCAVCSLAVALCLIVCVSATDKVNQADAEKAVGDAKAAVKTVCARAQTQLDNATSVLDKVESSNSEAAQAFSQAAEAAKGNPTAVEIAETIKSLSDTVAASHSDTKQRLTTVVNSLTPLLEEAKGLENEPEITVPPNKDPSDDFTETNRKATDLTKRAEELDTKITNVLLKMDEPYSKANDMEGNAKEAQLKNSHVSAIVAVTKIKTIIGKADSIIEEIQSKKSDINGVVQEIKTHCKKDPIESNETLKKQCNSADDLLTSATGAVEEAKNAKTKIEQQKGHAETSLTNVQKKETDIATAKQEADKAKACGTTADDIFPQLNTALRNSETSLKTANDLKQEIETALSKATSKPGTAQSVTHSQVKTLQGSVSAAVTEIQNIVEEADRILSETENHKKAVHDIVEEMQTLKTTAKVESNDINELCRTAEGEFTKMTNSVSNVTKSIQAIKQQQELAGTALTEVNAETDIVKAQPHVATATSCLDTVKQIIAQLRSELHTAKSTVTNANKLIQNLKKALSTTTTAPITEKVKETKNSDVSVQGGTDPEQKYTTIPPEITNTEQPTSKESPNPSNNSTEEIKDKLNKVAQNVPTTALTGGKAPAPGAKNDSAMTVSVPLLVALIASAVLQ